MAQCDVDPDRLEQLQFSASRVADFIEDQARKNDLDPGELAMLAAATVGNRTEWETASEMPHRSPCGDPRPCGPLRWTPEAADRYIEALCEFRIRGTLRRCAWGHNACSARIGGPCHDEAAGLQICYECDQQVRACSCARAAK